MSGIVISQSFEATLLSQSGYIACETSPIKFDVYALLIELSQKMINSYQITQPLLTPVRGHCYIRWRLSHESPMRSPACHGATQASTN
ncbi:hypothetical protein BS50DRAFT_577815 [Corynespora cassiicola Philippines]|uniref:Uncharacterized protein n=1 Tax=Corynespora cassiicola Philippines TaxID=1448308 RepID=A0A2T2NA34_CORCC|nr:hypothetical protein BS50DRAFT_577815 [Corynespora cassiicola Philippines]